MTQMMHLLLQAARAILPILFLSTFPLVVVVSAQDPLNHYCSNNTHALNTNYQYSLSNLLSNLSSKASQTSYSKATMGRSPYQVYAAYLCRGDADHETCGGCVENAIKAIVQYCPHYTSAWIWYDECLFRYSNESFFGKVDSSFEWPKYNGENIIQMDVDSFMQVVNHTLRNIATRTAKGDPLGNKYATQEVKLSEFSTLYALGQCTPDLSAADCYGCLNDSIISLFDIIYGSKGATLFHGGSCYTGYDIFPFYHIPSAVATPAPAPASSPVGGNKNSKHTSGSHRVVLAIVLPVVMAIMLLVGIGIYVVQKPKLVDTSKRDAVDDLVATESLQYDLTTLQTATNFFSSENKIGEGGFGSVYKGTLANGQEVAVKRLNKKSNQGAVEFKNEINLLVKLQHKNLARLLGFCLGGNEKLLVYEFVPNKSLDYFLFDPQRQEKLDWSRRYNIIKGIARGMLYLHEDSRLRIIHRDLKASNILLDMDLNPKISDFGLARIFREDQTHNETERVAGTFGYMAPEYIIRGKFSMKSDVYSFGVLVLEILSGRKNNSFNKSSGYLLGHARKSWTDGSISGFMDPTLTDSQNLSNDEVMICLQLSLLCVQKDLKQRPSMAMIVHMLDDNFLSTVLIPQKAPFFIEGNITDSSSTKNKNLMLDPSSVNEFTITNLDAR